MMTVGMYRGTSLGTSFVPHILWLRIDPHIKYMMFTAKSNALQLRSKAFMVRMFFDLHIVILYRSCSVIILSLPIQPHCLALYAF